MIIVLTAILPEKKITPGFLLEKPGVSLKELEH
jgi:hypothetical protein